MQDQDFRDQIGRLAKLIIALANDQDISYSRATYESREHWVLATGRQGQIRFDYSPRGQQLSGVDNEGPIDVALEVTNSVTGYVYERTPNSYVEAANLILLAIKNESLSDNVDLPATADADVIAKWQYAAQIMASIAAQSAGEIQTIISQKASTLQAQANNLGKLKWRGFTSEVQSIVGDLPKIPMLSWIRANSGQALAKRRAAGLPAMGRAILSTPSISWNPDTRKGGPLPQGIGLVPADINLTRVPAIPAEDHFEWIISGAALGVESYVNTPPDVVPALSKILIFHSDTMQTAPRFVRSGSGWADMEARPSDRIKITGKEAAMLVKSGFLRSTLDFGPETLICTMSLHEVLRAMGLCGYRSWAGVRRISFKETVPSGYKFKEGRDWSYMDISADMVHLEENGYQESCVRSRTWEPGPRWMLEQSTLIQTIKYDAMIWPDFGQITYEDEKFKTDIDPSRDHRSLPGELGALYRLPTSERVMVMRYLFAIAVEQQMSPDWYDWVFDR